MENPAAFGRVPWGLGAHPLRAFELLMLSERMKNSISFLSHRSPQESIPPTDAVWLGTNSLLLLPKQLITVTIRVRRWYILVGFQGLETLWRLKEILGDCTLLSLLFCAMLLFFFLWLCFIYIFLISYLFIIFFFTFFLLDTCSCTSTWVLDVCMMHILLLKDENHGACDLALLIWFRCWQELGQESRCLKAWWKPVSDDLPFSTVFSQV